VRDGLLQRFGEFARSSAPSAAFATAVVSMVLVAAPGTATGPARHRRRSAAASLASAAPAVAGGTAMGSLTATLGQLHVLPAEALGAVIGGVVGGRSAAIWRALPDVVHRNGAERADVRRFLYLNITTGMFWCLAILLAVMLQAPVWAQLAVLAVGLGVVNYQCLVTLQRVMAPMIARDSAARPQRDQLEVRVRMAAPASSP
jgi:hypothetical protein